MIDLEVVNVVKENDTVTTLFFDKEFNAHPGQFGMFWIAGKDQKPMSFSYDNGITVRNVGPFTDQLSNLEIGDKISMEGPLGNGFDIKGSSVTIIGGGFGIAPLRYLAEKCSQSGIDITSLLGFRTIDDIFFDKELQKFGDVYIATEDGSCGETGLVTCLFEASGLNFDHGYCCGPEPMLVAMKDYIGNKFPLQLSLERYMKCGIGLCGSCELDGLLVCKDGPVFYADQLGPSFGKYKRDKYGRMVPL